MSRALKKVHGLLVQLETSKQAYPRLLDQTLSSVHPSQRAEISHLASFVIRHRRCLHALLSSSSRRILKKAKIEFVSALEIGAARLLRGDEAGAMWSSVKGLFGGKKQSEKAQKALEKLGAHIVEIAARDEDSDSLIGAGLAVPLPNQQIARLDSDFMGVSGRSAGARLSLLYSLPEGLCQSWLGQFGEEKTREICQLCNEAPPLFARTQRLKTDRDQLISALKESEIEAKVCGPETPDAFILEKGKGQFRKTSLFKDGFFVIQDLTSQAAPLTLNPKPGDVVLDLCAAPGGKTTYLAEIMGDKGRIVAVDRKAPRLQKVEEACERLGLTCVETVLADGRDMASFPRELYDHILLDAPCSNTGVLRRRPEARWRYQSKEQKRFVRDQQGLIRLAASRLKNGGTMLYSVCSIEAEEGSGIVQWLLSGAAGRLTLCQETLHLPSLNGGDGGYQALLKKVSE